jgi:hypothetical protein
MQVVHVAVSAQILTVFRTWVIQLQVIVGGLERYLESATITDGLDMLRFPDTNDFYVQEIHKRFLTQYSLSGVSYLAAYTINDHLPMLCTVYCMT